MDPPCRYMAVSDRGVVLDLRELEAEEVECVRSWLYRSREVAEIWLAGANPTVNEALLAIAEDIRSLIRVERVWIQGGGTSCVQRGSVSYLRQHLLMDQYRAGEVSIDCDSDSDSDCDSDSDPNAT